jgi:hypothetical protein
MRITQPEAPRIFKGRFREHSVDRLMGFLTSFDRDVEIVVKPHKKSGTGGVSLSARFQFDNAGLKGVQVNGRISEAPRGGWWSAQ